MSNKYPAQLGKARKPAKEWDDREGMHRAIGKVLDREQLRDEAFVDLIANRQYFDRGIRLIAEHYQLANPAPKSVAHTFVLAPDGAFWRELALALLVDHVPYFGMRRRGPKATLRGLLPLIAVILSGRLDGDQQADAEALLAALRVDPLTLPADKHQKIAMLAGRLGVEAETLSRELAKSAGRREINK